MSVPVKKRLKCAELEPSCLPDGGMNVDDMARINEEVVPIGRDLGDKVSTKPEPPASAYVMWIRKEGMQLVKSKFPQYKPAALGREAEKLWLTLDPTVKDTYVNRNKDETEQWINRGCGGEIGVVIKLIQIWRSPVWIRMKSVWIIKSICCMMKLRNIASLILRNKSMKSQRHCH